MRRATVLLILVIAAGAIAAALLLNSGKPRRSSLAATLKNDKDPEKRAKAAQALGEMGPAAQDAVPVLLAALKDDGHYLGPGFLLWRPTIYVHDEAAKALVKIGGPEAVAGLAQLLKDPDYRIALRAARTLGDMGSSAKAAVPALIATLDHSNQGEVLGASLAALEKIGLEPGTSEAQAAVPVLKKAFQHHPRSWPDQRLRAIRLFRGIAPDDRSPIPALIEILADDSGHLKEEVVTALAPFGGDAVPPLIQALRHGDPPVRAGAAQGLARMPPEVVVTPLHRALSDPNASVRAGSARALGLIGRQAEVAVPALRHLLADKDGLVRVQTARALWVIDREARASFPVLVAASQDQSESVRHEAEQALRQIGPTEEWAAEALAVALKDKDKNVRVQAANALGQIGPAAKKAMPALLEAVEDQDKEVRLAVAKALARVDSK